MKRSNAVKAITALLGGVAVIDAVLLVPIVVRFQAVPLTWIAVEAVTLPALFAALPRCRWSRYAAGIAAGGVTLSVGLGLAEAATWAVLFRPLNVYLDWYLLAFAHELLVTNLGTTATLALEAAALMTGIGIWGVVTWCLITVRGLGGGAMPRLAAIAVASAGGLAMVSPTVLSYWPSGFAPSARHARDQVERVLATQREMRAFRRQLEATESPAHSLPRLRQVDVIIGFIESYGVSVHRDSRYAQRTRPALEALAEGVNAAGADIVTGHLRSPVQGGQSWLAHATALSGVWLDNQVRYDLLLRRGGPTLIDDLQATGHRSVGIFPAITRPWPDGDRLGYDAVFSAPTIDYAGPRLNWVTMPDQFTWDWFQRTVREPAERPIFAELALISSHAPWTPVLPLIDDWSRVGDGAIFEDWRDAGPAPRELWRDDARVRTQFARAMGYALTVAGGYAERHVDSDTLLILLGDHQPAPLITGPDASRSVPVHVISGDQRLLRPFRERGFRRGVDVPDSGPLERLSALRGWFVEAYGTGGNDR